MKGLREFQIDIFNLNEKLHEFEFKVDDRLFGIHEHSLIEKGSGVCHLKLDKTATMMTLHFDIDVSVELICDRSLDPFDYPIKLEEQLIIKFGEDNYSLNEEVLVIRSDTPTIDVSEFIYEFVTLAVPLKKLHPRYEGKEDEQPDLIYTSDSGAAEDKNEPVDPRWEALKKLKGNK